jgi:hypothetical protein
VKSAKQNRMRKKVIKAHYTLKFLRLKRNLCNSIEATQNDLVNMTVEEERCPLI